MPQAKLPRSCVLTLKWCGTHLNKIVTNNYTDTLQI